MNERTENYIKDVKRLTKEISQLRKQKKKLLKAYEKKNYAKMQELEDMKLISEISTKIMINYIKLNLIKIASLPFATKLSKSAQMEGFLDNQTYADYLKEKMLSEYKEARHSTETENNIFVITLGEINDVIHFNCCDASVVSGLSPATTLEMIANGPVLDAMIDEISEKMKPKQAQKIAGK